VYEISLSHPDKVKDYLSDDAKDAIANNDAEFIVANYGTLYMKSAGFGGVRIFHSNLDVRDSVSKTSLDTAITLSVRITQPC